MKAKLNGISIDYQLSGKKGLPALAFVHGFPFSQALWKEQVAAFSPEYRVLTYDLRGMGKSALGKAPQLLESYADDLLALLKHLKLEKVAVAGLSMGGYVALRALQKEPGRFAALLLCDTRADADSNEGRLNRAAGIKTLREKGVTAFCKAMLPKLLSPLTPKERPKIAKALLGMMCATKVDGACNALAAMAGRTDSTAFLKEIAVPVLVLTGSDDVLMPPAIAQAMLHQIPAAKYVEIPGAGHASNLDQPDAFNTALGSFLKMALRR